MNFVSLDLAQDLQQGIDACGFSTMTPIQQQAIVPARRGRDILAIAQTGTGKTAAYAIPLLQRLSQTSDVSTNGLPRALILTPTRELAEQLLTTIGQYAQFMPLTIVAVFGGAKVSAQRAKLKGVVDILIATPGRLMEHLAESSVALSNVEYVVLDESDRMLDMGFINDVSTLMQRTNVKRQTMLFSATLSPAVNELSHKILHNHVEVRANKVNLAAETVEHVVYAVEESRKIDLFKSLLDEHSWFQVLVFTSTKRQADSLHRALKEIKIPVDICHGDKRQNARRRALSDFKSAKIQVLISTEIAARGLDIQGLDIVVNYNLPYLAEDYVHRIGRTGRAGRPGQAISFVSREEERSLGAIERLIGTSIKRIHQHGFEVSDRQPLIAKERKNRRLTRSNKSSRTKIDR